MKSPRAALAVIACDTFQVALCSLAGNLLGKAFTSFSGSSGGF
jgi:hypothetical protein